jgi:hypothetical protein
LCRKEGVVNHHHFNKTPFLFWRFFAILTGRGWAAAVYPAGGDPKPQRTRTDCTAQAAGQAVPDARQTTRGDRDGGGTLEGAECVRNRADLYTLKHERFSTQECVQNH